MEAFKFTSTHEWVKTTQTGMMIGITEHAQQLLGDLVFVELPAIGSIVNSGDELGVIESVKAASDFYAPISGEIIATNTAILNDPGIINQDPYDKGWLVTIKPTNPTELDQLLTAAQYHQQVTEEY